MHAIKKIEEMDNEKLMAILKIKVAIDKRMFILNLDYSTFMQYNQAVGISFAACKNDTVIWNDETQEKMTGFESLMNIYAKLKRHGEQDEEN